MTPKIVGIAGGAASGKTTLARRLQERAGPRTALLGLDDFFLADQSRGPFITSPTDGRQHFDLNHPDAFDVSRMLAKMDDLGQSMTAPEIVLIEGVFALALEPLRERMHLKVFVWLDDDLRLGRKIVRNHREHGKDPAVTFQNYRNSGRPGHEHHVAPTMRHADIILHGEKSPDSNARIVEVLIHSL